MREHSFKTRLAVGAGGLIAAGGLAAFTIAGATGAMASGTGTTTDSVTVAYSTTLVDGTNSITFNQPASLPGWSDFSTVAISGTNNDPNGWTSTVTATDLAATAPATGTIPASDIAVYGKYEPSPFTGGTVPGLGPNGNTTPYAEFTEATSGSAPLVVDATSPTLNAAGMLTPNYQDGYALYLGLGIAPGVYGGSLNYVFSSN